MKRTNDFSEFLNRGVEDVVDRKHLEEKLESGKKLRVKLGIDPTSKKLHIGYAGLLWKMRFLQDLGHKIIFIIGDFTGLIGDTSDKESGRPMLTQEQVAENSRDYINQVGKILDLSKTETHRNSEWLAKLGYLGIAQQADQFGLNEFISRELIAKRMDAGKRVSLREVLYPLMQGYDSVAIKADLEFGGTDQRFNLLAGRTLQKYYNQEPQDIMILPLLEGTDGRKMSASWGNVINITDEPNDMFGKVMSLKDELITKYFVIATAVPLDDIFDAKGKSLLQIKPYENKKRLAEEIVKRYHGDKAAKSAAKEFDQVFSKKEKPTEINEVKVKSKNIVDVLVETKLAASKSESKRLLAQKGVKVDDKIASESSTVKSGQIIQVGKRKFVKVK